MQPLIDMSLQVSMLLTSWNRNPLQGLVLLGTPHSLRGLVRWVRMSVARLSHEYAASHLEHSESEDLRALDGIHEMQTSFRLDLQNNQCRVLCCYADLPDSIVDLVSLQSHSQRSSFG